MIDIAKKNRQRIAADNIEFINIDASKYFLPEENNFVFMFNPFDGFVLEKFLRTNLNHFKKYNSVIAYANDIQRLSLTKFGFETIFRDQVRKISLYQHNGNDS